MPVFTATTMIRETDKNQTINSKWAFLHSYFTYQTGFPDLKVKKAPHYQDRYTVKNESFLTTFGSRRTS